jgi:hypothetical protein
VRQAYGHSRSDIRDTDEEVVMGARAIKAVPPLPAPKDAGARPLSIRSLETTRPASDVINRVRGEFAEMRGFSPTVAQAARLFALTNDECAGVLRTLVQEGFLLRTPDGRYRLSA